MENTELGLVGQILLGSKKVRTWSIAQSITKPSLDRFSRILNISLEWLNLVKRCSISILWAKVRTEIPQSLRLRYLKTWCQLVKNLDKRIWRWVCRATLGAAVLVVSWQHVFAGFSSPLSKGFGPSWCSMFRGGGAVRCWLKLSAQFRSSLGCSINTKFTLNWLLASRDFSAREE